MSGSRLGSRPSLGPRWRGRQRACHRTGRGSAGSGPAAQPRRPVLAPRPVSQCRRRRHGPVPGRVSPRQPTLPSAPKAAPGTRSLNASPSKARALRRTPGSKQTSPEKLAPAHVQPLRFLADENVRRRRHTTPARGDCPGPSARPPGPGSEVPAPSLSPRLTPLSVLRPGLASPTDALRSWQGPRTVSLALSWAFRVPKVTSDEHKPLTPSRSTPQSLTFQLVGSAPRKRPRAAPSRAGS